MQAERTTSVRYVFPRLRERQPLIGSVSSMSTFAGRHQRADVTETCRDLILECRPRFLCMLGRALRERSRGCGVDRSTADEIHFAVLEPQARDRGLAFFYFREWKDGLVAARAVPIGPRGPTGEKSASWHG